MAPISENRKFRERFEALSRKDFRVCFKKSSVRQIERDRSGFCNYRTYFISVSDGNDYFLLILITKNFSSPITNVSGASEHSDIARTGVFVYIFSYTFSRSFLPLYAENLYHEIPWLSKDFVIGIPITVELFVSAIFLVYVGSWIDKKDGINLL
ncbi:MAG: hypothetical protein HC887_10150 [Desulfobacteraceae bacterium]|nr:hypothetical protein [Desulfobacteraceae bacterium]